MRFKGLDLNLLVAFDVLMATRSVSRSAERLHLSQPAMSAALARLRDYFGDELLVLQGKRMHPTAFAIDLAPQIHATLQGLEAMLVASPDFDPATTQRNFTIVTSDYVLASIIVPLVSQLAEEAPGVRINCQLPQAASAKSLDEGKIDMMISPDYMITGSHPAYVLYREPQIVIGWKGNQTLANGKISEADFFSAGHVAVRMGEDNTLSYADRQLELMSKHRRIEVNAPFFTAIPWLLEGTSRLALLHERLARQLEGRFEVACAAPPFEIPPMKQMLTYNVGREEDAGLSWLRHKIEAIAQSSS